MKEERGRSIDGSTTEGGRWGGDDPDGFISLKLMGRWADSTDSTGSTDLISGLGNGNANWDPVDARCMGMDNFRGRAMDRFPRSFVLSCF